MKSTFLEGGYFTKPERRKSMKNDAKKIRVDLPKDLIGGSYANNMAVAHTREEFIMDFLMIVPPTGTVTSRVILSPSHIKRIVQILQDNIMRYEKEFGPIHTAEMPMGDITLQ